MDEAQWGFYPRYLQGSESQPEHGFRRTGMITDCVTQLRCPTLDLDCPFAQLSLRLVNLRPIFFLLSF